MAFQEDYLARSGMQKMKILLVMKELLEKTDENHPVTVSELVFMLERNGIAAERKSVYHDIAVQCARFITRKISINN